MKKLLKIVGIVLAILIIGAVTALFILNEKEPVGATGDAADALAQKMIDAVDGQAWKKTAWVRWSFMDQHHYIWDKDRDLVKVSWDNYEVLLDTKTQKGDVTQAGLEVSGDEADQQVKDAWNYFCNDSYWLNPVVKAFDPGVERSIVTLKDGREGLKVKFHSGGTTPGDSYVWLLDQGGLPQHWKMWVKIIPIGGVGTSWEGWQKLPGGAMISTTHTVFGRSVQMIDHVEAGTVFADVGLSEDPFTDL